MDIESLKQNRFAFSLVRYNCDQMNFRYRYFQHQRLYPNTKIFKTWNECFEDNWRQIKLSFEKFKAPTIVKKESFLWKYCRMDAIRNIHKVNLNQNKRWEDRSYEILLWLNEKDHYKHNTYSDLWDVCNYYETAKLNMMKRNNYSDVKPIIKKWSTSAQRSYQKFYAKPTQLLGRNFSNWDWCFRIIQRKGFGAINVEWKSVLNNIYENFNK